MNVILKNGDTKMTISTLGAEPQSLVYDKREYLWDGNKEFWFRRAPLLFPMIGPTKDDKIKAGGKYYLMPGNGFARDTEFTLVEQSDDTATFVLEDTPESKEKYYPYGFILTVTYTLLPNGYTAKANIKAKDDLYYTFGWHPAFSLDINGEGCKLDTYSVSFEKEEHLNKKSAVGGVFVYTDDFIVGDSLDLNRNLTDFGAIILDNVNSDEVTLTSSEGEHGVTVTMGDMNTLTLWTPAGKHAQFICVEPMLSFGDKERDENIENMKETKLLKKGEDITYENTFTVF